MFLVVHAPAYIFLLIRCPENEVPESYSKCKNTSGYPCKPFPKVVDDSSQKSIVRSFSCSKTYPFHFFLTFHLYLGIIIIISFISSFRDSEGTEIIQYVHFKVFWWVVVVSHLLRFIIIQLRISELKIIFKYLLDIYGKPLLKMFLQRNFCHFSDKFTHCWRLCILLVIFIHLHECNNISDSFILNSYWPFLQGSVFNLVCDSND